MMLLYLHQEIWPLWFFWWLCWVEIVWHHYGYYNRECRAAETIRIVEIYRLKGRTKRKEWMNDRMDVSISNIILQYLYQLSSPTYFLLRIPMVYSFAQTIQQLQIEVLNRFHVAKNSSNFFICKWAIVCIFQEILERGGS